MHHLISVDEDGEIIQSSSSPHESVLIDGRHPAGFAFIGVRPPSDSALWDFDRSEWIDRPSRPSLDHVWDRTLLKWSDGRSLQLRKDEKWAELRAIRDSKETEPVEVSPGLLFDVDDRSLQRRSMALEIAAMVGETWTVDWTMADNTISTVTASDLRMIPVVMAMRSQALHERGRILRAQVMSAETPEELSQISWD